jgi:C1A family cysteine protease
MIRTYKLSPGGHIFDRKVPPPLPPHMMITRTAPLVQVVDLRQWEGPLKNQGNEGACTSHAGTEGGEWIFRKYLKQTPIFSPQYTYAKELQAQGDFPNDDGSDGQTLCEVIIANGFCELADYPYISGDIVAPTPAQDADAGRFKLVGAYHGLNGSITAQSVIADPEPWTVMMGFTVYESFESDVVANTGIYNPNPATESVLGGHEVHIVGCDLGVTPTLRPANCPPAFLVMNSWGSGWGWNGNGHFWAVPAVLNDPQTDLKVFHLGPPWK